MSSLTVTAPDDRTRCELLLVSEVGGTWALYPHGVSKLGVRLLHAEAVRIARAVLGEDGPVSGLGIDPELVAWLALRRVAAGRVLRLAPGSYVDGGRPVPGYIAEALTALTEAGLVDERAEPDQPAHRLALTDAGAADYAELGKRQRTGLSAPPSEFPHTPAGCRSSEDPSPRIAPGSQPDPTTRARWFRCPDDGRLHAVEQLDIELAPVRGHIEALCAHRLPIDATTEPGPSGALCLPCVVGVTSDAPDPGRFGGLAL